MLKAYVRVENNFHLVVDVAVTGSEIATGLSNRSYLGEQEGMLFIIHEPVPFWMKNMQIPIDILWLDKNQVVQSVLHNAQPCPLFGECPSYMPPDEFSYVLETVAGFAEKYDIYPGIQVPFQILTDTGEPALKSWRYN